MTLDGQIAEIVYNGEHNHPKFHPPKKSLSSANTEIIAANGHDTNDAGVESKAATFKSSFNCLDEFGKASEDSDCKKRTMDRISCTSGASEMALTDHFEPTPGCQSSGECQLSGDCFHWRKYGQKAVKDNSFPR